MGSSWASRGTYGRILKKMIHRQLKRFEVEQDDDRAGQIAHNVGYLIGIQRDLIKDEQTSSIEKRIEELEKRAGLR